MSTYDFVLKITNYNGGTVTLTSSPFQVREYHPRTAPQNIPTLAETCEVRVMDGSVANNLDEVRSLSLLLDQAREAQRNRTLDKVYLEWKQSAGGTAYRSELKEARSEWNQDTLTLANWTGDTQFNTISWERANWWEGPEAQIPLSNTNGTNNTSGLNVFNTNDGVGTSPNKRNNYVDVAGTAIVGDLHGATRLEMINTYATSRLGLLWIGQNYTNPSTFTHHYEAEAATHGGTAIAQSQYSGGTVVNLPVPTGTETELLKWAISSPQITYGAGRYFKAMLRFPTGPDDSIYWRIRIKWNLTTLWESGQAIADPDYAIAWRDFATFRLPPWLPGLSELDELELVLTGYQTTGAQIDQGIDCLDLIPVDGWRNLRFIGYGTAQNWRVIDDGIDERLYHDNGYGSQKVGLYVGYGNPIMLKPGTNQRLYFLQHAYQANLAEIDRTLSVKLFYRPRRLTL